MKKDGCGARLLIAIVLLAAEEAIMQTMASTSLLAVAIDLISRTLPAWTR